MWIDASSVSSGQRIKQKDLPAIMPGPDGINSKTGRMEVVPVVMSTIDGISQIRVPLPSDLKGTEQRLDLRKTVEEVKRRFPDGLPNLDPINNMSITDESFRTLVKVCPQAILSNGIENRGHGGSINR
jgi:ATP-dependent RNA helicase DOB1